MKFIIEVQRKVEDEVVKLILERTDLTQREIAKMVGVSLAYVQSVAKRRRVQRPRGTKSPAWKLKQQAGS